MGVWSAMGTIQLPDISLAVSNFLKHFESLLRLPFITDAEMDVLFGAEVTAALKELDLYNQKEKLCHECHSRCCLLVKCEFYLPGFSRCPVYAFRPLLCRMHYCNKFAPVYKELVKTAGDIFLESLLAGEAINPRKIALLDSPPLGKLVTELVTAVKIHLTAFEESRLDEESALNAITLELERYRS
jgi:hypothetical protein